MRRIINFNDNWQFSKNESPAASDAAAWEKVTLPHTWNNLDGQDGGNDYWRGTAVYRKEFRRFELQAGERCFIEFLGAAMSADVTFNGKDLVRHEGGYSAFRADITDFIEEKNTLIVRVDNSKNDRVYPQMADFTFYGGLYRDVNMIIVPQEHFELQQDGSDGIKVTPVVDLKKKCAAVTVETWHNADSVKITVNGESQTVKNKAEFIINDVHLWDGLNDPYLYTASAKLESGDEILVRFGCREFHMDPEKGFFLNGKSYPLRGVSRHQDRMDLGNALTRKEHEEDMAVIRELGANTLRLAHYQHAQEFYDLCDENGLIVWAEIPYITKHMSAGKQNALSQMRELITQCYNHPSIICWGLSNEITASSPVTEELLEDHRELNALCHKMDSTRPTIMAHAFMLETDSPLIPISDIASYNLYFGWYLGELERNDKFFDDYHKAYPDRVIGFSEYGADANVKFHSSEPEKGDYTEEYQCVYHEHLLKCIEERPYLWATHVWNLFDFAADGRDEGGKKGQNQKGLVEFDHKTKKDAFYLYKAAWSKEPFVHLCGKRFKDHAEENVTVKVYSNCSEVTLLFDGRKIGTKSGDKVFTFDIPLTAEHRIEAVSGNCKDQMTLCHVEKENELYRFAKQKVINWFDKEEFDPTCYSIKNTMGELSRNMHTAAILAKMMERMTASRGDVAKSANQNASLQKMMAGMTLESLIKQAGDAVPEEMIRNLNSALQKIKK
ncbi:MAG: glycoside hydrolase family 2 protein [Lachnospiraceae bacterium]|nr:glycoside hydrolase family 2 protein [Lachnospiraceae bacterium]